MKDIFSEWTEQMKNLEYVGKGATWSILLVDGWWRGFFHFDGIWWDVIPTSKYLLEPLVQPIAAMLTIVRAKATNTVTNLVDVKQKQNEFSWQFKKLWIISV